MQSFQWLEDIRETISQASFFAKGWSAMNFEEDDENEFSRADLLNFLGEFISQNRDADLLYRSSLCGILVGRIYEEFGQEGLCELMMQIDIRGGWISDIIFESSDFNNALFKRHGIYDDDIVMKARSASTMNEMNKKIWRLRRKYANIIADEIINGGDPVALDAEKETGEGK